MIPPALCSDCRGITHQAWKRKYFHVTPANKPRLRTSRMRVFCAEKKLYRQSNRRPRTCGYAEVVDNRRGVEHDLPARIADPQTLSESSHFPRCPGSPRESHRVPRVPHA